MSLSDTQVDQVEDHIARFGAEYGVPEHLLGGISRFVVHGIRNGSCIEAFMANDLRDFVERADPETLAALPAMVRLTRHLPPESHGSREKLTDWRLHSGLKGKP